jgi:hypothetical protein
MPYFGNTPRHAINSDGEPLSATEFLDLAERRKVDAGFFTAAPHAGDSPPEFLDGPPCLATLVQIGFPEGSRNNGLYNLAVFLKRRFPDDWEKRLHEYNERCMRPALPYGEVQQTISSFKRDKEYRYKCSESPITQHCNSGLCRTRKYGVGGGLMPEFGSLAQQQGDTVIWYWSKHHSDHDLNTMETVNTMGRKHRLKAGQNANPAGSSQPEGYVPSRLWIVWAVMFVAGTFIMAFGFSVMQFKRWDHAFDATVQPVFHPWAVVVGMLMMIVALVKGDRRKAR